MDAEMEEVNRTGLGNFLEDKFFPKEDYIDDATPWRYRKPENQKQLYHDEIVQYYDLRTDFWEYFWGKSFHFAPRSKSESVEASVAKLEHFIGMKLRLNNKMHVLDVGCGIGGPMTQIARFSRAKITGVNNNAYQIAKGRNMIVENKLDNLCDIIKAHFAKIPRLDETYDAAYAIEATCYAQDKHQVYAEIYRVLKPNSCFAICEWALRQTFNPENTNHQQLKAKVEELHGIKLEDSFTIEQALVKAGFEIVECEDLSMDPLNPVPWYAPFAPSLSLAGLKNTTIGKYATYYAVSGLEKLGVTPPGSTLIQLQVQAELAALVEAGEHHVFTPMYFFLARKRDSSIVTSDFTSPSKQEERSE